MCTAIDVEVYKRVAFEMLEEAGVVTAVNTLLAGAIMDGTRLRGVVAESRSGREAIFAKSFVDCTGYGDLAAFAGAECSEPNDYAVANSIGVGGVDVEKYRDFLESQGGLTQLALGLRDGRDGRVVRVDGRPKGMREFTDEARRIGMSFVTTTVRDDYFMFIKLNLKMPVSPSDRDAAAEAELELRRRQAKAVELFTKYVPGCEKAFIARTSPSLCVRRARLVACDYDISLADVLGGQHFDDDVMAYGFHDSAPRLQIANGGTYGVPYRALLPRGIENLLVAGMMITSDHDAHMSTRNTVGCMGQGQAAGTAAALAAERGCGSREFPYAELRAALEEGGVYFEE
ncbi:MAG: FAD-dependent oxidoreductase [Planctomycetota bacterium]